MSRIEGHLKIWDRKRAQQKEREEQEKKRCEENKERKPVSEWIEAVHDDTLMASQETWEIVDHFAENEALRLST